MIVVNDARQNASDDGQCGEHRQRCCRSVHLDDANERHPQEPAACPNRRREHECLLLLRRHQFGRARGQNGHRR